MWYISHLMSLMASQWWLQLWTLAVVLPYDWVGLLYRWIMLMHWSYIYLVLTHRYLIVGEAQHPFPMDKQWQLLWNMCIWKHIFDVCQWHSHAPSSLYRLWWEAWKMVDLIYRPHDVISSVWMTDITRINRKQCSHYISLITLNENIHMQLRHVH